MPRPEKPESLLEYEALLSEAWQLFNDANEEMARLRIEKTTLRIERDKAILDAMEKVFAMADQAREGSTLKRGVARRAEMAGKRVKLRYEERLQELARQIATLYAQAAQARGRTFEITRSMKLHEQTIRKGDRA